MRLKDPPVLALVVAAGCAATVAGKLLGQPALVWVFKPLTTALIAWVAWRRGLGATPYGRLVVVALVLSLVGDVLLIPAGGFLAGLVAFLLAHLAFLAAFTREAPLLARWRPFAAVAIVAGAALAVLWPSLPEPMRVPVLAYALALGAMVAQAHARASALGDARTRALALAAANPEAAKGPLAATLLATAQARRAAAGATLFLASDGLLAFDRFHAPIALAPLWVLGTYWAAQVLIATSVPDESPLEREHAAGARRA